MQGTWRKHMKKINDFIKTTIIGGIVILLPIFIIIILSVTFVKFLKKALQPIAKILSIGANINSFFLYVMAFFILVLLCFITGLIIKTKIGTWIFDFIEKYIFGKIPGYKVIKETINNFSYDKIKNSNFSSIAIVKPFGNDTLMTGFITDSSENIYTVFIPTGPNPTSGNIMHLSKDKVTIIKTPIEHGMKSIIGCGAGSKVLLEKYLQEKKS